MVADIQAANASSAPSTIALAVDCTYTLNQAMPALSGATGDFDGLPPITGPLTIHGNGALITRSHTAGTATFRILEIASTGVLHLNRTTLAGGQNPTGGGVYVNAQGQLWMRDSTLTQNTATRGAGGGLLNDGSTTITRTSLVADNTAATTDPSVIAYGGGIKNNGTLLIDAASVSNNEAIAHTASSGQAEGGGISNFGAMTIRNEAHVTDNQAESDFAGGFAGGAGIENQPSNTTARTKLVSVDISGNSATDPAGGGTRGAGIIVEFGSLSVVTSTIEGNSATDPNFAHGGGIYVTAGKIIARGNQITGNDPDNCEPAHAVPGC